MNKAPPPIYDPEWIVIDWSGMVKLSIDKTKKIKSRKNFSIGKIASQSLQNSPILLFFCLRALKSVPIVPRKVYRGVCG